MASAATVQVDKGKEVRADFSVLMQRAYAVTGSVSGMAPYRPVTLLLLTPDLTAVHTRVAVNAATGEFRVADVVPGDVADVERLARLLGLVEEEARAALAAGLSAPAYAAALSCAHVAAVFRARALVREEERSVACGRDLSRACARAHLARGTRA